MVELQLDIVRLLQRTSREMRAERFVAHGASDILLVILEVRLNKRQKSNT